MKEEVEACGVDFSTRRRADEAIDAMRALWADGGPDGASFEGQVLLGPITRTRFPNRLAARCRFTLAVTVRRRPVGRVSGETVCNR